MGKKRKEVLSWKTVVLNYLYRKDSGICQLCNMPLLPEDLLEIDHIIEKQHGGIDVLENLRLVHLVCHKKRHQKTRMVIFSTKTYQVPNTITSICNLRETLRHTEKTMVISALDLNSRSTKRAAKALGITHDSMRYRMEKLNISKNH